MKTLFTMFCAAAFLGAPGPVRAGDEARVVEVQHILVGFGTSLAERPTGDAYRPIASGNPERWRPAVRDRVDRTRKEARILARQLLERARAGEDFEQLEREYSDDDHPGVLVVLDSYPRSRARLKTHYAYEGKIDRESLPKHLGDMAFELDVGEVGLVKYNRSHSGFGWHIVRRTR